MQASPGGREQGMWSRELILLMVAIFLAYANISVFFQFYPYLHTLAIDQSRYGLLIGAFAATALVVRPLVSPWIAGDNAHRLVYLGTTLVIISLLAYSWADGFWSLFLVRILHAVSFVFMGAALMTLTVVHIPVGRSSQVFGILSIVIMLPNTIVPPVWPLLDSIFHGFPNVLAAFALFTALVFPFLALSKKRKQKRSDPDQSQTRPTWDQIKHDMADPRLWGLLLAMLSFYSGVALVFFYVAGMAKAHGLAGVGFFFTLTTICEIGVRLFAGHRFDQWPKSFLLAASMLALSGGYVLLGQVSSQAGFYLLALVLGLGWGVAMPVFNGLMFDWSKPEFRALNTNLGLQMYQGGFFLGPIFGGLILNYASFAMLYSWAAALALAAAGIMFGMGRRKHG